MEENQGCIRSCVGCGCSTVGTMVSLVVTFVLILGGMYMQTQETGQGIGINPVKSKSAKAGNKAPKAGKTKSGGKGKKR